MNQLVLAFLALLAIASAAVIVPQENLDIRDILVPEATIRKNGISGRGIILSSKGRTVVKNFVNQFKDGYKKDAFTFDIQKSIAKMNVTINNFTAMGLDNIDIKKLEIGYTFGQSVKFNFLWPQVNITGKMLTDSFVDVLDEYGLKLTGNMESDVELILENVIFKGHFKYTMPILFGSIEIYKFEATLGLNNIISRIEGLLGNGKLNKLLNDAVEDILLKLVNSNQDQISAMLESILVPFANSKFEGKNIWSVIG